MFISLAYQRLVRFDGGNMSKTVRKCGVVGKKRGLNNCDVTKTFCYHTPSEGPLAFAWCGN
jgi:hypothetical protein